MRRFASALALPLLAGFILSGCALGRSVLDIEAPPVAAVSVGQPVKIVEVKDARVFSASPKDPSQPSLSEAAEIGNVAITARAIGRKRNGYGAALGDFVLPENRTVSDLVKAAATKALQEKGYRVVDASAPDYASAAPVMLTVEQFWAWFTPGMFSVTMSFDSQVTMTGAQVMSPNPSTARGQASTGGMAAMESDWKQIIVSGLADLTAKLKGVIKPAEEASQSPVAAKVPAS